VSPVTNMRVSPVVVLSLSTLLYAQRLRAGSEARVVQLRDRAGGRSADRWGGRRGGSEGGGVLSFGPDLFGITPAVPLRSFSPARSGIDRLGGRPSRPGPPRLRER